MSVGKYMLKGNVVKACLLLVNLIIGLLCCDTVDAFYVAVLVQSLGNIYDSCEYIGDPSRLVTGTYVISVLLSVLSFVCSVMHFVPNATAFTNLSWVVTCVCIFLSVPFIIVAIRVFVQIRSGEY